MDETRISWRGALDWEHLAGFLGRRAIPGIESFDGGEYVRGGIRVRRDGRSRTLVVSGPGAADAERRVRRLFDLDADPNPVAAVLGRDFLLAPLLCRHPGIRVPGAWDPFEIVVRAIVGQQITVAAARSIVAAIAEECGERTPYGLAFPTADRVATAALRIGMPSRRRDAIRLAARAIASGEFVLERRTTLEETIAALVSLPGIGPWTANYIAMRALGETDAFPAGDLILRRGAGNVTEKQLLLQAEAWRPFRAYAAMLLWSSSPVTDRSAARRRDP